MWTGTRQLLAGMASIKSHCDPTRHASRLCFFVTTRLKGAGGRDAGQEFWGRRHARQPRNSGPGAAVTLLWVLLGQTTLYPPAGARDLGWAVLGATGELAVLCTRIASPPLSSHPSRSPQSVYLHGCVCSTAPVPEWLEHPAPKECTPALTTITLFRKQLLNNSESHL